ncbi:DUF433 domain-containing protein [candidate division KSB1 bacterium]|nr:DUF433 domain-containing protein [candidate division KSB1 bacterium]
MQSQLIESHPNIMMGKPVVAGTRITVELILEKLTAGETIDQILEAHPRLTKAAIQAAIEFAAPKRNRRATLLKHAGAIESQFSDTSLKVDELVYGK